MRPLDPQPLIQHSQHPRCAGKRIFRDFPTASRMARNTSRDRDVPLEPYRCMHCQRWHVGAGQQKLDRRRHNKKELE